MTERIRYFGKFRGVVEQNDDPERLGRIIASVPDVLGTRLSGWATPCVPSAGMLAIPARGSLVWIEFERGDPDCPVWTGSWWANPDDLPAAAKLIPTGESGFVYSTAMGSSLIISDDGGLILQTAAGAVISVNDAGITIENGKGAFITLIGPTVDVNAGALAIT